MESNRRTQRQLLAGAICATVFFCFAGYPAAVRAQAATGDLTLKADAAASIPPPMPHDPNAPTAAPSSMTGKVTNTFHENEWTWKISYTFETRDGTAGWHMDSINALRDPPKPNLPSLPREQTPAAVRE